MGILRFQLLTDNTIGSALDLRTSPLCSLEIFDPTQAHAQIDIWPIKKEVLMVPSSSVASVTSGAFRQPDTRLLRTEVYRTSQVTYKPGVLCKAKPC